MESKCLCLFPERPRHPHFSGAMWPDEPSEKDASPSVQAGLPPSGRGGLDLLELKGLSVLTAGVIALWGFSTCGPQLCIMIPSSVLVKKAHSQALPQN